MKMPNSLDSKIIKVSKVLSLILRHQPEKIGLELDTHGWVPVEDIITRAPIPLSRDLIETVVRTNDKKRFTLSGDGRFIRASQGHSIPVDMGLKPVEPPALLYHGTAVRFLAAIRADGLTPQTRQHVHLSGDEATAHKVGQRHGRPVILEIPALAMHTAGQVFYRSDNGVWLTDHVPAEHIRFPGS